MDFDAMIKKSFLFEHCFANLKSSKRLEALMAKTHMVVTENYGFGYRKESILISLFRIFGRSTFDSWIKLIDFLIE